MLSIIIGIIYLAPLKFGISIGVQMASLSYIVFGLVLIAVAVSRLIGTFSYEFSGLTKQISMLTSALMIVTVIIILFLEVATTEQAWFHSLFGISLLSYAIGRVTFSVLAKDSYFALRAFIFGAGNAIGFLSIIVILFRSIVISEGNPTVSLSYSYFVVIALILIGVDFLVSAIFSILLNRQKQSP